MSVFLSVNGTVNFQANPNGVLVPNGPTPSGLWNDPISVVASMYLLTDAAGTRTSVLRLAIDRVQTGTALDLLAWQLMHGSNNRGEKLLFAGQLLLIDENSVGAASVLGMFTFPEAFVASVHVADGAAAPRQSIVIHANRYDYQDLNGLNSIDNGNPIEIPGFAN